MCTKTELELIAALSECADVLSLAIRSPYSVTAQNRMDAALKRANSALVAALTCRNDKGWISVSDKLPEQNTNVLVCNVNGYDADEREAETAYFEDGVWVSVAWWDYDLCGYPEVTHWRHLPSPANA